MTYNDLRNQLDSDPVSLGKSLKIEYPGSEKWHDVEARMEGDTVVLSPAKTHREKKKEVRLTAEQRNVLWDLKFKSSTKNPEWKRAEILRLSDRADIAGTSGRFTDQAIASRVGVTITTVRNVVARFVATGDVEKVVLGKRD